MKGGDNMVKAYMISYDLNKKGQDYESLYKAIKDSSTGAWMHYLDSTWIITSYLSADEISRNLQKVTDNNDLFFIAEITKNYAGWLPENAWKYLRENIFSSY